MKPKNSKSIFFSLCRQKKTEDKHEKRKKERKNERRRDAFVFFPALAALSLYPPIRAMPVLAAHELLRVSDRPEAAEGTVRQAAT